MRKLLILNFIFTINIISSRRGCEKHLEKIYEELVESKTPCQISIKECRLICENQRNWPLKPKFSSEIRKEFLYIEELLVRSSDDDKRKQCSIAPSSYFPLYFKNLKHLQIESCQIHREVASNVLSCLPLTYLTKAQDKLTGDTADYRPKKIRNLIVRFCALISVPSIDILSDLEIIDLSNNHLTRLPDNYFNKNKQHRLSLKKIDLSNNHLLILPLSLEKLESLEVLNVSNNPRLVQIGSIEMNKNIFANLRELSSLHSPDIYPVCTCALHHYLRWVLYARNSKAIFSFKHSYNQFDSKISIKHLKCGIDQTEFDYEEMKYYIKLCSTYEGRLGYPLKVLISKENKKIVGKLYKEFNVYIPDPPKCPENDIGSISEVTGNLDLNEESNENKVHLYALLAISVLCIISGLAIIAFVYIKDEIDRKHFYQEQLRNEIKMRRQIQQQLIDNLRENKDFNAFGGKIWQQGEMSDENHVKVAEIGDPNKQFQSSIKEQRQSQQEKKTENQRKSEIHKKHVQFS
ncbi:hypothetical protein SNEBB_007802 [Seison nebaliae]|nr:hypothetical protein SNEBB_007802 [Seison nebaliae]